MNWEEDLVMCRQGVVHGRPGIVKGVVEVEEGPAGASPQKTDMAVAYCQSCFAVAHATAPAVTGASLLTCLSLGMTSWANNVMLFRVSSVGTLPTEKLATKSPKPTRCA